MRHRPALPAILLGFATGLLLTGLLPDPVDARGRSWRRARHRRARRPALAMQTSPLPPTWTSTTDGGVVVLDAEPDHVPGPLRISTIRSKLTKLACYQALRQYRIRFKPGPSKNGLIAFPVVVPGKIGGVHYKDKYRAKPMLADCQLVLALYRAAAIFRKHGIKKVLYSNTWRAPFWNFKRRRSMPARGRRMGHHPRGLAMDASVLVDRRGRKYVVEPDWEKLYGGPGNCVSRPKTQKGRLMRRIICDLERHHIFRRILTPDSDWDHRHHFHFTAPRVNEAFVRARWAGRTLNQPLPGTRTFSGWHKWHQCYRIRSVRRRYRCYRRRKRGLPKPPVRFKLGRQVPRVALKLVIPEPAAEPDQGSRAVNLDRRAHSQRGNARTAPRRAAPRATPARGTPARPTGLRRMRRPPPPRPPPARPAASGPTI
jgi:hypothetical protein